MTPATVIAYCRRQLQDTNPADYGLTDAELLGWCRLAQRAIASARRDSILSGDGKRLLELSALATAATPFTIPDTFFEVVAHHVLHTAYACDGWDKADADSSRYHWEIYKTLLNAV